MGFLSNSGRNHSIELSFISTFLWTSGWWYRWCHWGLEPWHHSPDKSSWWVPLLPLHIMWKILIRPHWPIQDLLSHKHFIKQLAGMFIAFTSGVINEYVDKSRSPFIIASPFSFESPSTISSLSSTSLPSPQYLPQDLGTQCRSWTSESLVKDGKNLEI